MAEAPEIKLTTDFLNKKLQNKQIVYFEVFYEDSIPEGYSLLLKNLPLTVLFVNCKGKFIYFKTINSDQTIYITQMIKFGGYWTCIKDDRCLFSFTTSDNERLFFRDTKGISNIKFTSDWTGINNFLKNLGCDILSDPDFSLYRWNSLIKKYPEKNVTVFLTDQNIISGCGNYIKSEALHYACISPFKKIGQLTEKQIEKLYEGLRIISRLSYIYGGLGKHPNGETGNYSQFLKVYRQKTSKRDKTPDNRITFWDDKIQK